MDSAERFIQLMDEDGKMSVNVRYIVMVYRAQSGRATVKIEGREKMIYAYEQYDEVDRLVRGA